MDDLLREFLTETGERLEQIDVELVHFEREPNDQALLRNIFRLVHTIKGTCGFLGLPRLEALAHAAETLMDRFRDGAAVTSETVGLILATIDRLKEILAILDRVGAEPGGSDADLIAALEGAAAGDAVIPEPVGCSPEPAASGAVPPFDGNAERVPETREPRGREIARIQTVRVGIDTLEHLMTMVSELVLTRNQLLDIARRQDGSAFQVPLQRLSQVTAELQDGVMKTRMQPIGAAWQKLPRMVRDVAAELGKSIDLVLEGAETELDRQVLEVVKDPLVHLVRNCADHGLEAPRDRLAAGKPERGTIRIAASHEGGTITITVTDDGRGLDYDRIRRKALERGLATRAELERMSQAQVVRFILRPGFSTAAEVTALSGRGVGLDVVKTNLDLVGGSIEVQSEPGRGTSVTVKIPLTVAIVAALIVGVADQRFAIPQAAVIELVRVGPDSEHAIERVNGAPVLRLRDRLLPILSIRGLLQLGEGAAETGFVVTSQVGLRRFGFWVESLFHTEEIVAKPLCSRLRAIPFFSGHTILGDGAVVLILDPGGMAAALGTAQEERPGEAHVVDRPSEVPEATTALLVFRAGSPDLKAVALSLVSRLEEIDAGSIEWAAGRPLVQYRRRLMPIVAASPGLEIRRSGTQSLIVLSDGARPVGVAVDDIVDIVEDVLAIEVVADRPDLVGSAILRGRATEIVDPTRYLVEAHGTAPAPLLRAPRTVLLVDASAFLRDMLAGVVRAAGYRVLAAGCPDEALALAEGGERVDFVVADIDGTGSDGFGFVERLRRSDRLGPVPVVAIAATVSREAVERARSLQVADFVQKFDRTGLLTALAEAGESVLEAAA